MPKVIPNHAFGGLGLLLWRLGSSWRGVGTSWCDLGELLGRLGSQFSVNLAPRCTKMDPSWCQDAPSWHLNGHLDAIWEAILLILGILGAIFKKIAKVENRTIVQQFCYIFTSWRVWFEFLGHYYGQSWPQLRLF